MSADGSRLENPALLAAIIAHPDEDTPRLMYADWLQENDDEARAEFIRLHIEWDHRPLYVPPDEDLKRRLVTAWKAAGLNDRCDIDVYERGFISVGHFDVDRFADEAAHILRANPIRVIWADECHRTQEARTDLRERFFAAVACAQELTGLGASSGRYGLDEYWTEYLQSPESAPLRMIDFGGASSLQDCQLVAKAKHLTNLLVLDLNGGTDLDEGCLEVLASAPHLKTLTALRLGGNDDLTGSYKEGDIRALTESPYLTHLTQLVFNNNDWINNDLLQLLLEWNHVERLRVLELGCTEIDDDGYIMLSQCPRLAGLQRLVVGGWVVRPETIGALLDSPHLQSLKELYISAEGVPADLRRRLDERFPDWEWRSGDPPPVCLEDRIRRRYRLMDGSGYHYGYREYNRDEKFQSVHPEYRIL